MCAPTDSPANAERVQDIAKPLSSVTPKAPQQKPAKASPEKAIYKRDSTLSLSTEAPQRAGWMTVEATSQGCFGKKVSKRQWFQLTQSVLTIHNDHQSGPDNHLVLTGECAFEIEGRNQNQVVIITPERTLRCACSSSKDASSWMDALKVARSNAMKRPITFARLPVTVTIDKGSHAGLGITIAGGLDSGNPDKTHIFVTKINADGPGSAWHTYIMPCTNTYIFLSRLFSYDHGLQSGSQG